MTNELSDSDDLRKALQERWQGQMENLPELSEEKVRDEFSKGCPECLAIGSEWVHLRMCLICGQVGCCDSSPQTHARLHWEQTGHAVVRTIEPDEDWKFNYELNGYLA